MSKTSITFYLCFFLGFMWIGKVKITEISRLPSIIKYAAAHLHLFDPLNIFIPKFWAFYKLQVFLQQLSILAVWCCAPSQLWSAHIGTPPSLFTGKSPGGLVRLGRVGCRSKNRSGEVCLTPLWTWNPKVHPSPVWILLNWLVYKNSGELQVEISHLCPAPWE